MEPPVSSEVQEIPIFKLIVIQIHSGGRGYIQRTRVYFCKRMFPPRSVCLRAVCVCVCLRVSACVQLNP